jgi:predicted ArsR family transcriptional regulator
VTNAARRFLAGLAGLAVTYNADQAVTKERQKVRLWMAEHPGGTLQECATELSLDTETTTKHWHALRAEWEGS